MHLGNQHVNVFVEHEDVLHTLSSDLGLLRLVREPGGVPFDLVIGLLELFHIVQDRPELVERFSLALRKFILVTIDIP